MNGEQYFAPKHIFGYPSQEMTHAAVTPEQAAADATGKLMWYLPQQGLMFAISNNALTAPQATGGCTFNPGKQYTQYSQMFIIRSKLLALAARSHAYCAHSIRCQCAVFSDVVGFEL